MLEEQAVKSDWSKREIGAFWTRDSAKGKYLSGNIEIDELNILNATLKGMQQVVEALRPIPDYVLIDGNRLPKLAFTAQAVVKGDQKSKSIAAASILAKVTRDTIMQGYAQEYPQWEFSKHF